MKTRHNCLAASVLSLCPECTQRIHSLCSLSLCSSIKTKHENDTVTSHLYLATAAASDSGKYTCAVGRLARAKLSLHILNGESVSVSQSIRPYSLCAALRLGSSPRPRSKSLQLLFR